MRFPLWYEPCPYWYDWEQVNIRNHTFKVRLRGLNGIETQDYTWFGTKRPIYFLGIYEGLKTLDQDEAVEVFINQVRLHFAFGHRISRGFRYELHYIVQRSRLFADDGLQTTQNIFRV